MSEYPVCRCDVVADASYPIRCTCGALPLEYHSSAMHLIARDCLSAVAGSERRSRSEWIAGWLQTQQPVIPLTPSRVIHAVGSITATAIGRHRVDPAERDRRQAICDACPTDQLSPTGQCRACSCVVRAKSLDAREFCPHGHWPHYRDST